MGLETPVLQNMSLYTFTGGAARGKGDSFAFRNNPSIYLLIFISAFLNCCLFQSTLYSGICVKLIFDFFFAKHLVDECFVGTYVVKLRS